MSVLTQDGVINYASFASDFSKREILRKFIDVTDDAMGYFDWMDFTNRAVSTGSPSYDNITQGSLFQTATVKTTKAAAAADADSVVIFKGGAGNAKPYVSEVMTFKDFSKGYVYAVAANASDWDVTLRPIGTGNNIPLLTAEDAVILSGNAQGEGGELTDTVRRPTSTKRSNNIQTFTTMESITDLGGATVVEIPFNGKHYPFSKLKFQQHLIHRMQIATEFLTSVKGSSTNAAGEKVWFTGGMRPQVVSSGFNLTTAGAGVYDLVADQKALSIAMDTARCGAQYILLAGQSLDLAFDTNSSANSAFTSGGISYAAYGGSDKIALALGVKSMTFGGRTIHKQRFKPAEHPTLLGADGYTAAKKEGYLIPTDKVKTLGDGGSIDRMRVRHMNFNGNKDLRYITHEGGMLAPTSTNAKRVYEYTVSSNQGLEMAGVEQFGLLKLQ